MFYVSIDGPLDFSGQIAKVQWKKIKLDPHKGGFFFKTKKKN
jgi:hypothetical protein